MPTISSHDGDHALTLWSGGDRSRRTVATAVRYSLQVLAQQVPGRSVEVRVPPFGVVQCLEGSTHTRGTPPNVIESAPQVWLQLVTGQRQWNDVRAAGDIDVSGHRADLSPHLPLFDTGA